MSAGTAIGIFSYNHGFTWPKVDLKTSIYTAVDSSFWCLNHTHRSAQSNLREVKWATVWIKAWCKQANDCNKVISHCKPMCMCALHQWTYNNISTITAKTLTLVSETAPSIFFFHKAGKDCTILTSIICSSFTSHIFNSNPKFISFCVALCSLILRKMWVWISYEKITWLSVEEGWDMRQLFGFG